MPSYGARIARTPAGTFSDPRDQPFDPANVQWGERESGSTYSARIAAAKATRAAIPARVPQGGGADEAKRVMAENVTARNAALQGGPGVVFGRGGRQVKPGSKRAARIRGGPPGSGYNHLGRFATGRKRREATSYQ